MSDYDDYDDSDEEKQNFFLDLLEAAFGSIEYPGYQYQAYSNVKLGEGAQGTVYLGRFQ